MPGDRVATLTGTSTEHVVVFFACAKAGLILMPLNTRLAPPELAYQLADAEPAVLLCSDEYAETAAALHQRTAGLEELVSDSTQAHSPARPTTTGSCSSTPRARPASRRARCSRTPTASGRTSPSTGSSGVSGEDTVLQVLPQFHVGGWNVQPLLAWWKGATVVLEPAFDPARALALIAEKHVTTMMGVPATYLFMSQDPGFAKRRPLDAAARGRRRRADARGAAGGLARARRRDRPGLRAHRGGAERPLPAARGRGAQARLRRQALPARRRRAPRSRVRRAARRRHRGRARRPGPERVRRLLAEPGGHRRRLRGRLAPDRRRRGARRGGLLPDRRPDEGHGHLRRRERLPGRDRERPPRARRRRGSSRRRRSGRALGRGLPRLRRPARRRSTEEELLELCRSRLARYKVPRGVRFVESLPRNALDKVVKSELLELVR